MDAILRMLKDNIVRNGDAYYEYLKSQEVSLTKRDELISNTIIATQTISVNREVFDKYREYFFKERGYLREIVEKSLTKAIEDGDVRLAEIILKFAESVYSDDFLNRSSDFVDL